MDLFPLTKPYRSFFLEVSDLHTLYVEESGNPAGKPAVFLHGGPGGTAKPKYRQFFDPKKWRVIMFDQRGCGKSTPFAELRENTTWDLVKDMETIRTRLGIASWVVVGGSWGATLALAYAQRHPSAVKAMTLRGIFLLRQKELRWFYQEGASFVFPDFWEDYVKPIPMEERGDMIGAFYRRLTSEDRAVQLEAAQAWSTWEGRTNRLTPDHDSAASIGAEGFAEGFARIECHYFINRGFFDSEKQLLHGVHKIRHIPTALVQGRYDMVCPMVTAYELHKTWPELNLHLIANAGHSLFEPGIQSKVVQCIDEFAKLK